MAIYPRIHQSLLKWLNATDMLFHCLHCITSFGSLRGILKQSFSFTFLRPLTSRWSDKMLYASPDASLVQH